MCTLLPSVHTASMCAHCCQVCTLLPYVLTQHTMLSATTRRHLVNSNMWTALDTWRYKWYWRTNKLCVSQSKIAKIWTLSELFLNSHLVRTASLWTAAAAGERLAFKLSIVFSNHPLILGSIIMIGCGKRIGPCLQEIASKGILSSKSPLLNRFNLRHHLVVCESYGKLIDWQQRCCNNYKWPWPKLIKHWSSDANTIFVRIWRAWQILRGDIWPQPVERYALPAWQCLTHPALVQQDNCTWHLLVRDLAMKKQSF